MSTENLNEDLEPEYELSALRVLLDVDVAEVFPDSEAVNQALRFLIRITKEHQPELDKG